MTAASSRPAEGFLRENTMAPSVLEALHCLRVAITIFDADERLIFANDHFGYMFRSLPPRKTLLGRRYDELIRLEIAGGDIPESQLGGDIDSYVARRRAQLFARDYGARDIPLADGRIVEIKTRRTPGLGWVALWSDVTEARRNLERLAAAIALSADAFAFYDRQDRLLLCNEEYAVLNGAESSEDLKGLRFEEVVMRAARHAIPKGDMHAWLEKRRQIHTEPAGAMAMELNDGTAYLLRDRAASDGGRIVVFTDVTEHTRAERALAEQTQALAATRQALAVSKAQSKAQANYLADLATKLDQTRASADTTKKTLLRTMSHELKTPLNAIIGFSDLLKTLADSASPDQIREYAGLIHLGGHNLLRLLNQILDLTKISAGRYELNRQLLDAGSSLWNAKDRFDGAASTKDITIVVEDVEAGLIVDADENAYTALLGHLVENAVAFTQKGGEVRLSAMRDEGVVCIAVSDNGPGVATEDLPRILEPFEQGGRSTTDHSAGAGLGLTLVKAFAELHGGRLLLKSAKGEGFKAIVELPAA